MSHLLTRDVAQRAVEFVLPAIARLIETKVLRRGDLHIVVANPTFRSDADEEDHLPGAGSVSVRRLWNEKGILYEHSLGDRSLWQFPFDKIARSKCYLSWYYNMPTQVLQTRAPHLLRVGETVYYGSAVSDGLVVACSGVQPYFDQMISGWVLEACRALCIQGREALGEGKDGFVSH